jgi:hypothetical protein
MQAAFVMQIYSDYTINFMITRISLIFVFQH